MTATPEAKEGPVRTSVVIADDADDVRLLLRLVVESSPTFVVVAEATNGQEAVDAATAHRPDIILLDVSMPELDGLEAIPLIREASAATKIVMVSGLDAAYVAAAARELGADAYVEKGTGREHLLAKMTELCS